MPRERIACAAIAYAVGDVTFYYPVAVTRLVMDEVNWFMKNRPDLAIEYEEYFITTAGRAVDKHDGYRIALEANQLYDETVKGPLQSTHIWPRK